MSVILIAFAALAVGSLLAAALSLIPQHENTCAIPVAGDRRYDVCVLYKAHKGKHIAADGYRFE